MRIREFDFARESVLNLGVIGNVTLRGICSFDGGFSASAAVTVFEIEDLVGINNVAFKNRLPVRPLSFIEFGSTFSKSISLLSASC